MVRTRRQRADGPETPPPPRPPARQRTTRPQTTVNRNHTGEHDNPTVVPVSVQQLQPSAEAPAQQQLAQQLASLAQALSQQTASSVQASAVMAPSEIRHPVAKHIPAPKLAAPEGMTIIQFRDWKQRWNDFAVTQQVEMYSLNAQHSILRSAMHSEWTMLWNSSRLLIKPDSTLTEIVQLLEKYLRKKRNPLLDRQEFHHRDQMACESVDQYYAALKSLDDACGHDEVFQCQNCQTNCAERFVFCDCGNQLALEIQLQETRIRDRFICGLRNREMQRKVLAEQHGSPLTIEKVLSICTAVENSNAAGASLGRMGYTEPEVNRVTSTYKKQATRYNTSAPRFHNFTTNQTRKCLRCGGQPHNREQCPAKNERCKHCNKLGHLESVCFQKTRNVNFIHPNTRLDPAEMDEGQQFYPPATMRNVTIFKAGINENLIQIPTLLNNTAHLISWLPDTGADVDALSIQDIEALGKDAHQSVTTDKQEVFAANGSSLGPVGSLNATLRLNGKLYETKIRVFEKLTTPLLSKIGCIALGLLDEDWPASKIKCNNAHVDVNKISSGEKRFVTTKEQDQTQHVHELKSNLIHDLQDAFDDTVLRPMNGPPMKIELVPGATPCRRYKAHTIPFHWRDQVKAQLEDMKAKGVIEPVPIGEAVDWCHPMVVVPKKGTTEPRITVDLTGLNPYVRRPVYPVRVPREVVARIPPGCKYFTTLDARHGYWQVPLDEESKKLTTFITPWGCYRYCRNVMGLISAGDEHNRRGDEAIKGIDNVEKIVEDILIYDEDLNTHEKRVRAVIGRCRDHCITLNARKFVFAKPEVDWCGFRVTKDGYSPAPHLVQALSKFPVPKSKTDVRSFCGLVQQFEAFSSHISELALPIRALLPKNAAFLWDSIHQQAFNSIIQELSSPRVLAHFDPGMPVRLETDGAQSKGLGFALWQQQPEGPWKLLQAGSRFVTPTEARYSATEIELLAVVWAVRKCRLFLLGSPFELVVDHRPLTSIINAKTLDEIDNPRIQRLKEKLACFRPQVVWRAGKQHIVVDVFSRYPSSQASMEDKEDQENETKTNFAITLRDNFDGSEILQDPILNSIKEAGSICSEYRRLFNLISIGFPGDKQKLDEDLRPYWKIKDQLAEENGLILWGSRLLIPPSLRRSVLENLHSSHQGQERTLRRARQTVFWPNIANDIRNVVRTCNECSSRLPSQQREHFLEESPPTRPFECVGVDLFKHAGYEYLVMVDKFSGWLNVAKCGRSANASNVIHHLKRWMIDLGIVEKLISDNGPQFSSLEFKNWARKWGISLDPSSPHYPQANGLAESGVKAISSLLAKTSLNGDLDNEAFQLGLLELRNTPRSDGRSPSQLVFGLPIRSQVPLHRGRFACEWRKHANEADYRATRLKEKAIQRYNATAKTLPHLKCGEIVLIQDPRSKEWNLIGEVIDTHRRGRSYTIRTESGRTYWRNRRFLRRYYPRSNHGRNDPPSDPVVPRRSTRYRQPPMRYGGSVPQLDQRSSSKRGACGVPVLPHMSRQHRNNLLVEPAAQLTLQTSVET